MNAARTIARLGLQEAIRRRVFLIVAVLTVGYLALYGLGVWQAFQEVEEGIGPGNFQGVEPDVIAGATLLGLNMFGTLFLGTILAVFLTLGAVRGDAERGLLQPLLVRPVHRRTLLMARFASSALVCGAYVIVVFTIATTITWALGGWWPDRIVEPALGLAGAVAILCALSLAGSVFLASTANGIAVFLTLGAVRGDAERGLLQPLLVRPVPRRTLLAARFAAASLVCGAYVIVVFLIAAVITWALGGWWPDRIVEPALGLAASVAIVNTPIT